ncbi:hypothetical protein [Roseibium sp. RKSG952]|uniref:hypothetical protein n=1 Tax=Roseibium sp. RKSG952 TaxID=2529384 RepID=UPI0012BB980B|nr:hypothetical protein [Roseibium sp. RKSG952]MTH98170.1 hypothetical protein [Roseibium sp. RKSG952]
MLHHSLTDQQQKAAKSELQKIFILSKDGIAVDVFSKGIDSVWHEMLDTPDAYADFCLSACGAVVGHQPSAGSGSVSFIESYERRWGKLPDIWFTTSDGSLDASLKREYDLFGTVHASWNCTPTHACMDMVRKEKQGPPKLDWEKQRQDPKDTPCNDGPAPTTTKQ